MSPTASTGGGATARMLDIWKSAAPSVDVIAPDIYVRDYVGYRSACGNYARADKALLAPETFAGVTGARYLFYAVGDFDAIGLAPFGFNSRDGSNRLAEAYRPLAQSYRLLAAVVPVLAELRP